MEKRILHLLVPYKVFVEIAEGQKKWVFRKANLYWIVILENKEFDEIHLTSEIGNFMKVEWKSTLRQECFGLGDQFTIALGAILETRNYKN